MTCKVPNCQKNIFSSSLCSKHYNRLRTTGTVEDGPRARASFEERFWRQVDVLDDNSCWNWNGKSLIRGYGVIGLGGRKRGKILSHRASWIIANGEIPTNQSEHHGFVVMHTCDNRLCCNPKHLKLGTQRDNVQDMINKNRGSTPDLKGEKHPNSRFTEDDIKYIRSSKKTNADLGREFSCARQVIGNIRNRISWKHV